MENGTRRKTVIFTVDIFAVYVDKWVVLEMSTTGSSRLMLLLGPGKSRISQKSH